MSQCLFATTSQISLNVLPLVLNYLAFSLTTDDWEILAEEFCIMRTIQNGQDLRVLTSLPPFMMMS